ncbi:LAQU0S04e09626g1_1 [Lachancea quebecensis]|uniref:LAQU0S04e09626g1_1 n=1 Tax=Lachancea quebecensis TaxID=1654605 RepID=A0A0P1KQA1_9SACH|nr:LAQU0S04e09626g1_1 [Lachancea quebecensis]
MAFLVLTSEVSTPFVIPAVSPVSPAASRKNSCASLEAARKN